jgi:hypothetical protein
MNGPKIRGKDKAFARTLLSSLELSEVSSGVCIGTKVSFFFKKHCFT